MGNNSVPKFIFRLSRFPVYRGSVLGRFYCSMLEKLLPQHGGEVSAFVPSIFIYYLTYSVLLSVAENVRLVNRDLEMVWEEDVWPNFNSYPTICGD